MEKCGIAAQKSNVRCGLDVSVELIRVKVYNVRTAGIGATRGECPDSALLDEFLRLQHWSNKGSKLMGWIAPAPTDVAMRHTAGVKICN